MKSGQGPMRLSVIIATVDRPYALGAAVASVRNAETAAGTAEIVVVDQGQNADTSSLCARNAVRYVGIAERGLSRSRNIGLRLCTGTHVAFLDDDATVDPSFVREVASAFAERPDMDAICGRILNADDRITSYSRHQGAAPCIVRFENVDAVLSSAFVVRREALDIVGGFDEAFGVGAVWGASEETDLVMRIIQAGQQVAYAPSVKVYHPRADFQTMSLSAAAQKAYGYGLGRGALLRKHWGRPGLARMLLIAIAAPVAGALLSVVRLRPMDVVRYTASLAGRAVGFLRYPARPPRP
jgi:glycosyltransferase involved in cell wall biosynthesis